MCVSCMLTFAHVGSFFLGGGGGLQAADDPLCIDIPTLVLWV